jgi:hypothetical protein
MSDLSVQREGQRKTASDEEDEVQDSEDEEEEEQIDWKDEMTAEEIDGAPVTLESFVQWKEKFDAERKKSNNTNLATSDGGVKLTGTCH